MPSKKKNNGAGTNVGNALRWLAAQGKEIAPEILDIAGWQADLNSDSWASKNIRPYTLAFLLVSMFIFVILDSAKVLDIKNGWVGLLENLLITAVGGYFVIRGGEKITKEIKRN